MSCKTFSNKACNLFKTVIHLVAGFWTSLHWEKSYQVTFANRFSLLQMCLKTVCVSAGHGESSGIPPGRRCPLSCTQILHFQ